MSRQSLVAAWSRRVLGDKAAFDVRERALRVLEEAIELAQACGVDVEAAHKLVDYVFARPVGNTAQEIAGLFVTAYSCAAAIGVEADAVFSEEWERIQRPEVIRKIQRRQHEKREAVEVIPGARFSEPIELPDGSGVMLASFPLPKTHWIYDEGADEPPAPEARLEGAGRRRFILNVMAVTKYAVRASTMRGREMDFDPDAMVQNMVVGFMGHGMDLHEIRREQKE